MAKPDHGIKAIADTTGRQLARMAGVKCRQWRPLESTLPATTELLADRVFLAQNGRERFVVYFEFYTRWDRNAPWDMLAKSSLLSKRLHLPTVSIVVVFRPRGFHSSDGQLRLTAAGGPTQHLWFREVCLWQVRPQPWWEGVAGLMALYPLCRHERDPQDAIIHATQVIENHVTAPGAQADFLALLGIFGKLAYPHLNVRGIIGREKMKESKFYQEVRDEGKLEEKRAVILEALEIRLGAAGAAEFAAAVNALEDKAELDRLFRLAVTCSRAAEFRAALRHR